MRTLLVDDSAAFLDNAGRFLALDERVAVVGKARSGREALEQVALLKPDLVLMDWQMPEMSGVDATRCIKSQCDAPLVVMLTQHDSPVYRQAAAAAGADGFITKAELGARLLPMLATLGIGDKSAGVTECPGNETSHKVSSGSAMNYQPRILIVDDCLDTLQYLNLLLSRAGYLRIRSVNDSRGAMQAFFELAPDLVLMDLIMPHLSGIEVMTQMRDEAPGGSRVPILVLTADTCPGSKRLAAQAGARDFLNKPVNNDEVLLRVKNLLQLRRLQLDLDCQRLLGISGQAAYHPNPAQPAAPDEANEWLESQRCRDAILRLSALLDCPIWRQAKMAPQLRDALDHAVERLMVHSDTSELMMLEGWLDEHERRDADAMTLRQPAAAPPREHPSAAVTLAAPSPRMRRELSGPSRRLVVA